jgi:hypothetical protein
VTIKLQRMVVDAYSYEFSLELVIGCAISDTFDTVYGLKLYYNGSGEQEIGEIAAGHKAMVSIEKKLIKMEASLGYTTDSNYLRRWLSSQPLNCSAPSCDPSYGTVFECCRCLRH